MAKDFLPVLREESSKGEAVICVYTPVCVCVCVCLHTTLIPMGPQIQRLALHLGRENKNPLWAPSLCLGGGRFATRHFLKGDTQFRK